ncbi:FMN-dependent NADH-azoreductase [Halocynthiibacter styelae]|uniref:FMN dependent NADH:quinone oxidoreductase n=1 Tax=Halocynthiibacter styelae TaxID=2761955 RepID=A0A8J7IU07_9RHOB|nr:NAD(P)H-dependent oxidoreductase [Paenihalocynthiibacter styelae]MBI1493054.1 NAD(P)H-dependent oxidoreductase [Paenihalocynthiibacter styelae]
MTRILHIDASARIDGSVSRDLSARIVARFEDAEVIRRDLNDTLPHVDEAWVGATFTPADVRSDAQKEALALSDSLVEEVEAADVIVIGLPIYNFSVPASLKAWIDQITRAGRTFQYTEEGPQPLLSGKRAILAIASGGVPIDSPVDFATPLLRTALGFNGISEVEVVAAAGMNTDPETAQKAADDAISALAA